MELVLIDPENDEVLENGKESYSRSEDYDGLLVTKNINSNLKQGKYHLKLIHKASFNDIIRNALFGYGEKLSICQPFLLDISVVSLEGKIKHQEKNAHEDITNEDAEESNAEIQTIEKKDLADQNIDNFIVNVDPPKMNKIRLNHNFV